MTRFPVSLTLCAMLACAPAWAQTYNNFSGTLVHPLGPPDATAAPSEASASGAAPASPAVRQPGARAPAGRQASTNRLVVGGKGPRMHTQDLADAFEAACVKPEGSPEAAADWALANGFSPLPPEERVVAAELPGGAREANVFGRDSDPLMLVSGGQPVVCAVMTRHSTDGQRMRARMERLVASVAGNGKPPKPVVSMKMGAAAAQLDGYRFSVDGQPFTLTVMAPITAGSGIAFMAYAVEAAAAGPGPAASASAGASAGAGASASASASAPAGVVPTAGGRQDAHADTQPVTAHAPAR